MATKRIKLKKFLQNEIRMRFAPTSILNYDDNKVIHQMLTSGFDNQDARAFNIMNPNIVSSSYELSINQEVDLVDLPKSLSDPLTQELLDYLEIRPTKEMFQRIREKEIKLAVVGYGGAMLNMLYNMYVWSMELSETRVFENIIVFEKDTVDFSNIVRFGKPVAFKYVAEIASNFDQDVAGIKRLKKRSLIDQEKELSKKRKIMSFANWMQDEHIKVLNEKNYVIVGAPNLDTRNILHDLEAKFYFFGHSDTEVEVSFRPQISSGLAVETYGTIDIPVLLINLQLATAAFLKELAYGDERQSNDKILTFDLKDYLEKKVEKEEHV
jgi:hypothetical protein